MSTPVSNYDVLIIGGGPGGSTAAMVLARRGLRVCLLEKERHPRFHIGESILPRTTPLIEELGLTEELARLPQVPKLGAEFGMGNDANTMKFVFQDGLLPSYPVFNIERSVFDKMLIDQARLAGAEVLEQTAVKSIDRLEQDHVEISTADRKFTGRLLIDASGHSTIVARHLGIRRNFNEPELQKVAYFQHFDNVQRLPGGQSGYPSIFMADEGWFWIIGLNETRTSVGFVTRPSFTKEWKVPPNRLLQWAITRCPMVRDRMRDATGPGDNLVLSDFSYVCSPQAGPGYFLVGDAGCFLDPVFSTGVTLAMVGGNEAAKLAIDMFDGKIAPARAQRQYIQLVERSTGLLWKLIRKYYDHSLRELFLTGQGPYKVHRAIISILAGQVFPKPVWALRWRMRLFDLCMWLQKYVALAPRRPRFRLVDEAAVELPKIETLPPSPASAPSPAPSLATASA